ncbi:uncharacterized protein LOC124414416 [Diprion similis]|uniref:uncharacterized protein LOC124414416 n=1 Tax=Diprion similis TaxID=362088 RepID=UPI001EF7D7DB|nr:uncharacterized protein LOC124414416 [Diprion similis]
MKQLAWNYFWWPNSNEDIEKLTGSYAHSKWPEIMNMKNDMQAQSTIKAFKTSFSEYGSSNHVVNDNSPQPISYEFEVFPKRNGVKHSFTPPNYPAMNEAAENFVQTFKDKVDKVVRGLKSLDDAVNLFSFDYRSTKRCTTNKSLAWLMFRRELRTRFDLLKPSLTPEIEKKQYDQMMSRMGKRNCDLGLAKKTGCL